ncbi:MAG: hypothetical protein AAGK00_11580 [Pseudomonadota bacterium]
MLRLLGPIAFLAVPLSAQALPPDDRAAINASVHQFLIAYQTGDADQMVAAMPPSYVSAHARRVGLGPGFYRSLVVHFTEAALTDGSIEELEIDPGQLSVHRTPDGIEYGLIPTRSITSKHGMRMEMTSQTLALKDQGTWWLIQVNDDNQISVLREVYPSFQSVAFDRPQKTQVE